MPSEYSETTLFCRPSPSCARNEGTLSCRQFFAKVPNKVKHHRVVVLAGDANGQHTSTTRGKSTKICTTPRMRVMSREMQREVNMVRPFQNRLQFDYSTSNHHSQIRSTGYLDCCFSWLFSHGEHRLDPELWEISGATRVSVFRVTNRNKLRTA